MKLLAPLLLLCTFTHTQHVESTKEGIQKLKEVAQIKDAQKLVAIFEVLRLKDISRLHIQSKKDPVKGFDDLGNGRF